MPILLQDLNRDYQRYRHTAEEKVQLARAGFQHVLSSNVSAIAQNDNDLIIRFHGGATYRYPGSGDLYDKMLRSNSKGRFVWVNLIRKNVAYRKVAGVGLKTDAQFTDRDLMETAKQPVQFGLATLLNRQDLINSGIIATNIAEMINGNVAV